MQFNLLPFVEDSLLSADLHRLPENTSQHKTRFLSSNPTFFFSIICLFLADNVNYHLSSIFRVTHKTQFHRFKSGNISDRNSPDNDIRISIT